MSNDPHEPHFFAIPADFRSWLELNHLEASELWVGFHKKDSGLPSLTWPESVDEALCFGWIDGIRKSLGAVSYKIRFTPRKTTSIWSAVNMRRMDELIAADRVAAAGLAAFARRRDDKSAIYAYEQRQAAELDPEQVANFERNPVAWQHFQSQPAWYRRQATYWVVSAKRPETRAKRLATLIDQSAKKLSIAELQRPDSR